MPLLIFGAIVTVITTLVIEFLRRKLNRWLDERERKQKTGQNS